MLEGGSGTMLTDEAMSRGRKIREEWRRG